MNEILHNTLLDLLPIAVLLPLLVAVGFIFPAWRGFTLKLAPWTPLPSVLLSLLLSPGAKLEIPWLLLGTCIGLDSTGQVFLFFTSLLWLLSGLYTTSYLRSEPRRKQISFYIYYLLSMSGNLGLIVSLDMASFFFFYALMSFSAYGLVVHSRDKDALRAGRIYMVLVVVGEVLLFSAIAVYAATGNTSLPYTGDGPPDYLIALVLLGFGIKAGALPLHVWLPLAHPAAPVPASAVLSGAMIKAGLLGWIRFLPMGTVALPDWGLVCISAGFAAAFYGVAVGVTQGNPKTVLAYSSISQMGLMTLIVGLGLLFPSAWSFLLSALLIYATHHAFAKGALFLAVGVVTHNTVYRRASMLITAIPALALAGLPLTSGAIAKTALKTTLESWLLPWGNWILWLLPIAAIGTTTLMARFLFLLSSAPLHHQGNIRGHWSPWLLLIVIGTLVFWVWPVSRPFALASLAWPKLVTVFWPLLCGTLLAWLAWRYAGRFKSIRAFRIPAGDLLVLVSYSLPYWKKLGSATIWADLRSGFIRRLHPAFWRDLEQTLLRSLSTAEQLLRQGPVVGIVFLTLIFAVFLLTAFV